MTAPNFLRIPLSMIQHVDDVEGFQGLSADQRAQLPRDYDADELAAIRDALKFAVEHPGYDFASMLPGITQSNAQIHRFLVKVAASMG